MTFRKTACFSLVLAASAVLLGAGCGGPQAHPVSGKVLLASGEPASGGVVEFRITNSDGEMVNAHGEIQSDGTFDLTTFDEGDGALEGEHEVIVVPPTPGEGVTAAGLLFPVRYASYETSGLRFKVDPEPNEITIELEKE